MCHAISRKVTNTHGILVLNTSVTMAFNCILKLKEKCQISSEGGDYRDYGVTEEVVT
jgi:hypothetical protein